MRFSNEIMINKPAETVAKLFDDKSNLMKWQPALRKYEPLSGTPGMAGSKALMTIVTPKGEMEITETITVRNIPGEISGVYEGPGIKSELRNYFIADGKDRTLYRCEADVEFSGVMKLAGIFMAGMIEKQSKEQMENFKRFAESV